MTTEQTTPPEQPQTEQRLAALEQQATLLRQFLDAAPAIAYVKDTEGVFWLVNAACAAMIGRPAAEIVGKNERDFFPPEVVDLWERNKQEVIRTGAPIQFEETFPHAGSMRTYLSYRFPIRDQAGQIVATGGLSVDITEQQQARDN
jgi:PAS domain S-box-containing protein